MKRKNKMLKPVLTAGLFIMIIGAPGYAAAGEPTVIAALYAPLPPAQEFEPAAAERRSPDPGPGGLAGSEAISKDRLPAEALMLPPDEENPREWTAANLTGPRAYVQPEVSYYRTSPGRPLLGLGWDHDTDGRSRWNVVLGVGMSHYPYWSTPDEGLYLEAPASDRDQIDLFEKLINAMQVVGFQIRYDF